MNRYIKTILTSIAISSAVAFPGLSQSKSTVNMDQYLFPEFTECIIKASSGTVSTENGNYNTITGKMAFMKANTIYGLAVTRQADTISFGNRHFVPFGEVFHEVVVNAPITLYIQHENRLILPASPSDTAAHQRSQKSTLTRISAHSQESTASRFRLTSK